MDIDTLVGDFVTAITEGTEATAGIAAAMFFGEVAKDIRRLADAQTLLANIAVHQAGVKVVDGSLLVSGSVATAA